MDFLWRDNQESMFRTRCIFGCSILVNQAPGYDIPRNVTIKLEELMMTKGFIMVSCSRIYES